MSIDIPPRNTSIKFRRKGETEFTTGKTSKSQPKKSSKYRDCVNFQGKDGSSGYSVEWAYIEEWYIHDEGEEESKTEDEKSVSTEQETDQKESSENDEQEKRVNENLNDTIEEMNDRSQYRDNRNEDSNSSSSDDLMAEFNKLVPPYQPRKDYSSPHSESMYSTASMNSYEERMSQDMTRLSIDEEDTQTQRKRKRTPLKDKVQTLKKQLDAEREKNKQLEAIISKITSDDETKIKQELSETLKTLNIYKEDMAKILKKQSLTDGNGLDDEFDIHPKTRNQANNNKSHILNINSKLNKNLDRIQKEYDQLKHSHKELSSELEKEKAVHAEYALLQVNMMKLKENDPEKMLYETEKRINEKENEVECIKRKYDELKYKLEEKSKETNQMRQINYDLNDENNNLKSIQAKDEIILSKNEQIISLLKEKTCTYQNQAMKLQEELESHLKRLPTQPSTVPLHQSEQTERTNSIIHGNQISQLKTRQGLPNQGNFCYLISALHSLAVSISREQLQNSTALCKLVKDTKNCIEGHKTEREAHEIIEQIWTYTKSKWPEYENEEGSTRQECTAEYMRRLAENDDTLNDLSELYMKKITKCYNDNCPVLASEQRKVTNVIKAEIDEEVEQVTLQEIADSYLNEKDEIPCHACLQRTQTTSSVKKAPEILILEIPRAKATQDKTSVQIEEDVITIKENDQNIQYKTKAIVIHKGELRENGHYIVNYYNENNQRWEQIDDQEIIPANHYEDENKEGVIYILKRERSQNGRENLEQIDKMLNDHNKSESYRNALLRQRRSDHQIQENNRKESEKDRPNRRENSTSNFHRNKNRNQVPTERDEIEIESRHIEMKKNNIILKGLDEYGYETDMREVIEMNKIIGNEEFNENNILKMERIGSAENKPRPLKIILDSQITKIQVMRNAKNLQYFREYDQISIQHDFTAKQMIKYREMVEKSIELEAKYQGRYIFRVRGPPGKWEIQQYPKNSSE